MDDVSPGMDNITVTELSERLGFHPISSEESEMAHSVIRDAALFFATTIAMTARDSREASLALTAVQEAALWAISAVSIHGACDEWAEALAHATREGKYT